MTMLDIKAFRKAFVKNLKSIAKDPKKWQEGNPEERVKEAITSLKEDYEDLAGVEEEIDWANVPITKENE